MPSIFFPVLGYRGEICHDVVSVPNLYWTADILYFKRPAGLDQGREITFMVQPEGWEAPVKVRFHV